ncbi:hypothetical protein D3C85_1016040 [compost metagenome]
MRVHVLAICQNLGYVCERLNLSNDFRVFDVVVEVFTVIQLNVISKTTFDRCEVISGEVDVLKRLVDG